MKDTRIFKINEIITIVMEEVRTEEIRSIYGIDEEGNYPRDVYDKLENMQEKDFEEFMRIIDNISKEIIKIKTGELNELNKCHEEIIYFAEKYLQKFIVV